MSFRYPICKTTAGHISRFAAVLAVCCFITDPISADVPAAERDALMALYDATNGAEWLSNSNWGQGDPCHDEWFGVSCTNPNALMSTSATPNNETDTPILEINLFGNNLTGPIPKEIGLFPKLITIELGLNELSGDIPAEIGNLSSLRILNLSVNPLTGPIPVALSQLEQLEVLRLQRTLVSGNIPPELGQLQQLKELSLGVGSLADLSKSPLAGNLPAELVVRQSDNIG